MKIKKIQFIIFTMIVFTISVIPASAVRPFGNLFYDGSVVRTVVPPAVMTKEGVDNFYVVVNGDVAGQLGIAAVAPGDRDYRGGKWAFHTVMWLNGDPYLLTSEEDVLNAETDGDVMVTRVPENDFKCPIQP
ncbi:MAG: hypothetical protein ACXADW_19700 [Candidatus Hodarchaeales archaeon]|jgi:hypothetical protein